MSSGPPSLGVCADVRLYRPVQPVELYPNGHRRATNRFLRTPKAILGQEIEKSSHRNMTVSDIAVRDMNQALPVLGRSDHFSCILRRWRTNAIVIVPGNWLVSKATLKADRHMAFFGAGIPKRTQTPLRAAAGPGRLGGATSGKCL